MQSATAASNPVRAGRARTGPLQARVAGADVVAEVPRSAVCRRAPLVRVRHQDGGWPTPFPWANGEQWETEVL